MLLLEVGKNKLECLSMSVTNLCRQGKEPTQDSTLVAGSMPYPKILVTWAKVPIVTNTLAYWGTEFVSFITWSMLSIL